MLCYGILSQKLNDVTLAARIVFDIQKRKEKNNKISHNAIKIMTSKISDLRKKKGYNNDVMITKKKKKKKNQDEYFP